MNINFTTASLKDFENIPQLDLHDRVSLFSKYLNYLKEIGHMNYRLPTFSGCGPEMLVSTFTSNQQATYISFVSNDYLGFTQHPKVKAATIASIERYGTGAGASPLIGGLFNYHEKIEQKVAQFFGRDEGSCIIYTTGYTANSASLMSLLKKEDIAIVDMAVHASVYEGCLQTNTKMFLHNDVDALERVLKQVKDQYRTKMVIVDGVYSQDGDIAPLKAILEVTKRYGALLMVDDAHGIGVLGNTGRGVVELFDLFKEVDILTGTFSKAFGHVGGFVIAHHEIVTYLKFQSRQHIFSATASPAIAGIGKAIDLIDEEPHWRQQLLENVNYFKSGLRQLGMNVGTTESAIIPVKIGDAYKTGEAGKMLLKEGIYTNPIVYPAVAKKDSRIRMGVMATHTKEQLDSTLNAFAYVDKKLQISHAL